MAVAGRWSDWFGESATTRPRQESFAAPYRHANPMAMIAQTERVPWNCHSLKHELDSTRTFREQERFQSLLAVDYVEAWVEITVMAIEERLSPEVWVSVFLEQHNGANWIVPDDAFHQLGYLTGCPHELALKAW
jgi:hypothetical protein